MNEELANYISEQFGTALERQYIKVYYQPVVRTISGKLCSFEALARWDDPAHGLIGPDQFIPVLERERRIHLLDGYVIREVCRQIRSSIDREEVPIPVSFNLSRLDFRLCDVFEIVDASAREFQVPHEALCVEVTESVAAEEEQLLYELIDRFHAAGYEVWMDDFGSGYSTLNVLKDYPFDELKLDMRFLSSMSQRSRRILNSVIHMAKEIEMHTLAEGVETEEEFRYLRDIGCEKVQGFYFGRPLPFLEAIASLREKGIRFEKPRERKYYDELGMVNVLSPIPYPDRAERERMPVGRELNSIPLAIAEIRKDSFSILFCNRAFEETALATGFVSNLFAEGTLGTPLPFSRLPVRVYTLADDCRGGGQGSIQFVANEEYHELTCKCVARMRGVCSVLLTLNNLSRAAHSAMTSQLDEGLRQLYTLYDRIVMLDLENDVATPLYVGALSELSRERLDIRAMIRANAEQRVFRDDREEYLRFFDLETLEQRMAASGSGHLSCYLRTHTGRGRYGWKLFTLLRVRPGKVVELVRDVQAELERYMDRRGGGAQYTPELLWKNLVASDIVRLFWKDADRRFLGANRAFLEYYGFGLDDIVGKNDEEMGWHIHPDSYMLDELRVLQEGVSIHNIPGRCIRGGENREILASKAPLYDEGGQIRGLIGCFIDRELLSVNDSRGRDTGRRDQMTGLLNSRGLYEEAHSFQDEYYLRGTDFVRLHVSIDDIAAINRQFGFDFGDKAIETLGKRLKKAFGKTSAVGRVNGYQFVILRQLREKEAAALRGMVKKVCDGIREIDGVPITLYFSFGWALFSESEDMEIQSQQAEMRMLADHDENASAATRLSRASEIFRMYNNLPIACAVYRIYTDSEGKPTDAGVFYVNHLFEVAFNMPASRLVGMRTSELLPNLSRDWIDLAVRAALDGESAQKRLHFSPNGKNYFVTAFQVICPGYCCLTYQPLDNGQLL